jgi:hypothetical protein
MYSGSHMKNWIKIVKDLSPDNKYNISILVPKDTSYMKEIKKANINIIEIPTYTQEDIDNKMKYFKGGKLKFSYFGMI